MNWQKTLKKQFDTWKNYNIRKDDWRRINVRIHAKTKTDDTTTS